MSKKANPTIVGAFVLVAIVLTVAAIIVLGKIKLKDDKLRCVAFFTGSLYGLDIGAPVTFRGVTIGRVSQIRINFDKEQNNYIIPVYVDIEQSPELDGNRSESRQPENIRKMMQELIGQGLRAQLKISSLLTAKLYIDLAIYPNTELQLRGKNSGLIEIPTMPSGMEQITQKLESLPLNEILNKTAIALDGINSIINSKETRNVLGSLESTLGRLNTLLGHADAEFPALAAELKKGLTNFATLSVTANTLLHTADKELPGMSAELKHLLTGLNATAGSLTKTLNNVEQLTAKDSLLAYQVASSLREIERAAASIRQLTDYLQQKPNALLFGQGEDTP
ncbi:MlaD family protein [uncultured Desulfobulbus sp.]|uniref:MlaD family protein n=1 Tax=uncultured Desulfobulbus sp. TaxID=239745 RepID=UPI0029C743CE|nr:MlaD family protein [uncultured Desulfobulbus sp.]